MPSVITFDENGLGSWKLALGLILGWGILWSTQTKKIFKTRYYPWRHRVPLGHKKCQVLITFDENGLGSWKLALGLILGWGILWSTQPKNIFKTRYSPVLLQGTTGGPTKMPSVNNFWTKWTRKLKIGIGTNFEMGNTMIPQTKKIFKTRYHLWRRTLKIGIGANFGVGNSMIHSN